MSEWIAVKGRKYQSGSTRAAEERQVKKGPDASRQGGSLSAFALLKPQ
ncbi:hypothetical protein KIPB_014259, partial [Kipferlia bialata]|eukprot:g14259.t1